MYPVSTNQLLMLGTILAYIDSVVQLSQQFMTNKQLADAVKDLNWLNHCLIALDQSNMVTELDYIVIIDFLDRFSPIVVQPWDDRPDNPYDS